MNCWKLETSPQFDKKKLPLAGDDYLGISKMCSDSKGIVDAFARMLQLLTSLKKEKNRKKNEQLFYFLDFFLIPWADILDVLLCPVNMACAR